MADQPGRKIVLGLGNTLNKDEGLGVHAVKALEARLGDLPGWEFVDGGVLGLNLLSWVEGASHLLILDAVNARQEPAAVIEMEREEIPMYTGIKMSDHQITFQEVLGLAKFREKLPDHLYLIGAVPVDLGIGTELSPQISEVIPDLLSRAERIIADWDSE
ncbi:MAG: HyaD/HybD family hydrogenase maturation endopeptidase [Anaerolineales bacterium]